MDFQNYHVMVTGAGQGIGLGICQAFAAAGATVALNDVDDALAQLAAQRINDHVGAQRVFPFGGDISLPETSQAMLDHFAPQWGAPDVWVANAGITKYVEFLQATPADFEQVVGVNLRGTYFSAQAAARSMIQAQKTGRILMLSSVVGLRAFPNFSIYGMTKAALQMLTKSLALELGNYGITVNAISPGATLTERTLQEDPHYAENWASVTLTQRAGRVDDIAAAALFLASPQAAQITGQNLVVDGGWSLRSPLPPDHPVLPAQ